LMEFPLGVFGVALSTVILPNLSRKFAQQNPAAFSATLDWALRLAALITLQAALGLAVLATPILVTMFQYQAFGMHDVAMTALSLSAYALGLPAFIAVKVLAPGYYARQDTATPVRYAVVAMTANMLFNFLLVGSLLAIGFGGPHAGLALASSLAAWLNAGLLFRGLRRQRAYCPAPGWGRVLPGIAGASVAMAAVLAWQAGPAELWGGAPVAARVVRLAALIGGGVLMYALVLLAGGLRPRHFGKGGV